MGDVVAYPSLGSLLQGKVDRIGSKESQRAIAAFEFIGRAFGDESFPPFKEALGAAGW